MKKVVCIHGHFYQPPRENPWLEAVEVQDSAHPFHDWNERITVECYAPNGAARLVDHEGRIVEIVNNYARMSFNFGPTLLSYIETHSPEEYRRIVEADRDSCARHNGRGNAIAQPYNHMIMPLASERDRETQIVWGVREFERHFGRAPEGMWLPEAAVDLKTLDLMAAHGIKFTILAPRQARRFRPIGKTAWTEVSDAGVDTSRPYLCKLSQGRSIALFFYNAGLAHDIAFGSLLGNGEEFGRRLMGAADPKKERAQLVHVATDGESYGHHWRHGDMALAYALATIERGPDCALGNYASFLAAHPPDFKAEIWENSSWSCAHGIARWRADCGCKLDPGRNWQQRWRGVMRDSFDWLRGEIDPLFESMAGKLVNDPWAARNDYISVVANRDPENVNAFFERHKSRALTPAAEIELLKLLEMQRHGMLMYTSCGWFFDDISGLEPVQDLKYACRAIQLADELGLALEHEFIERLAKAPSNIESFRDGGEVYRRLVRPAMAGLDRVAAHSVMEGALEGRLDEHDAFCYRVVPRDFRAAGSNGTRLAAGRIEVHSRLTRESTDVLFTVLGFGDQNVQCSVRPTSQVADQNALLESLIATFQEGNLTEVIRGIDRHFDSKHFTLRDLFLESRRKIISAVMDERMRRYQEVCREMYEQNRRFMEFVREADVPAPKTFLVAAEEVLNEELRAAVEDLQKNGNSSDRLTEILERARRWKLPLQLAEMEPQLRAHLDGLMEELLKSPDEALARRAAHFVAEVRGHNMPLYCWQAQNRFQEFMIRHAHDLSRSGPTATALLDALEQLGEALGFSGEAW